MMHVLWDTRSNNLVATFDNRADALALVRRGIEHNGAADSDSLALEAEDERGEITPIAHGEHLAALATGETETPHRAG